jgi:RNA polymerase sigma-70 factor, ECF subfamily
MTSDVRTNPDRFLPRQAGGASALEQQRRGPAREAIPAGPQGFEALLRQYSRLMASAARRVCGRRHRELVDDVEQEVRLALWRRLQGGRAIDHPASYLYKVALTTALALIRRQGETEPVDERTPEMPSEAATGTVGLLAAERSRLLQQVLAQLPAEQERALRAHLAGFNHHEVAALYGWSPSVARHRIYRGLDTLRARIKEGDR